MPKKGQKVRRHGLSHKIEYRVWVGMVARCHDPQHEAYARYGGRGIRVCERWRNSVECFIQDMGARPSPKHEIDRWPDNNGNYEPDNCRWTTRTENSRNRRSNRVLEHAGESLTLAAWSDRHGVTASLISKRIDHMGWSAFDAITKPARSKSPTGMVRKFSPCIGCSKPCQGTRCRVCEDKRRRDDE